MIDAALAGLLAQVARRSGTAGYGELARALGPQGSVRIADVTAALERLMAEDAARGRPLRAALCHSRLGQGLPAAGFFEAAARLGRAPGPDPGAFVAAERAALWAEAREGLSPPAPMP